MGLAEDRTPIASGDAHDVDLAVFLRRNRWLLVAGLLLGAAVGIGASFVVTPRWEADVVVQIGTMPEWSKDAPVTVSVESPARAVERIGQAAFKDQILSRLGVPTSSDDPLARMFRDSVRPRTLDKPGLVAVRVWGPSKADAERFATGIVEELAEAHERVAKPTRGRFERYLKAMQDDLAQAEAERAKLAEATAARAGTRPAPATGGHPLAPAAPSARAVDDVFIVSALAARDEAIRSLKNLEFSIREVLSTERNFATAPLLPVRVDDLRVYPRRSVFMVAGAGLGLVLASLVAALTGRRRR